MTLAVLFSEQTGLIGLRPKFAMSNVTGWQVFVVNQTKGKIMACQIFGLAYFGSQPIRPIMHVIQGLEKNKTCETGRASFADFFLPSLTEK